MDRRNFLMTSALAISGATLSAQTGDLFRTVRVSQPQAGPFDEGPLPDLGGAVDWLNTAPINTRSLHGKVVLINFWTYSCINSLRPLPYIKSWAAKYANAGLIVIGVHTPEFAFEKQRANVEHALHDLKITYPVAMDSNYRIWHAFYNEYWPAFYLVDWNGRIRRHHFGEGDYGEFERAIQGLLRENGASDLQGDPVHVSADGAEAAPGRDVRSPETYLGYAGAERFASPGRLVRGARAIYVATATPVLNEWSFSGVWEVGPQSAAPRAAHGKIVFRFHSRDLHLVMGPGASGNPIRFKVTLDGIPPNTDCGTDSASDGTGEVREPRLYQLIRQKGDISDRTFEIEFSGSGMQAYAFTFG